VPMAKGVMDTLAAVVHSAQGVEDPSQLNVMVEVSMRQFTQCVTVHLSACFLACLRACLRLIS
jgi:hypothetical protein